MVTACGPARIIHIVRQSGSLTVTAVTAASTLNALPAVGAQRIPVAVSWAFGLVVTELPLQTLREPARRTGVDRPPPDPSGADASRGWSPASPLWAC